MWHDSICRAEALMRASGLSDVTLVVETSARTWAQRRINFCLVFREMSPFSPTLCVVAYVSHCSLSRESRD